MPRAGIAQRKLAKLGWLGWVGGRPSPDSVPFESFRAGLRELGWHEGSNLVIESRSGDRANSAALARQLMETGVNVIVAQGPMVFGARGAVGSLPLLFSINGDPVGAKLVTTLARPGGMLTGVTALSAELSAKRLEFLRELVPHATRVAAIANQAHAGVEVEFEATQAGARRLGLSVKWFPVYSAREFDRAFEAMAAEGVQAVIAVPDTLINLQAGAIAQFAARRRVPAISGWAEFAEAGNVLSYGPSLQGFYRHVAVYADKVLKGASPGELPVEQPKDLELVINAAAAKATGIGIPQTLSLRASRVIQ